MNKDFTIIFEKMDEQVRVDATEQESGVAILGELDELAELRRVVAEITEPEPLSFTTS
jgi:hypothetical protein